MFTSIDKDIHRAKRKIVGPALSEKAMKSFEPLLLAKVDVYLRQILQSNRESKKVNIAEKMRYLALDIVAKLGFGYDLATQTNENN